MQPPENFQRPGIPGAGNILDPAVRGDLRERLQSAVRGACDQLRGQAKPPAAAPPPDDQAMPARAAAPDPAEGAPADGAATTETAPAESTPSQPARPAGPFRAGPFPHGDVDLRMLPANVIPARPHRSRTGRRFYFLPQPDEPSPTGAHPPAERAESPKGD